MLSPLIDNAKVTTKGQITIPKEIREALGITSGDRVTFIVEGDTVRLMNSAIYAMEILQKGMQGEADKAGINSEDAVMDMVAELRNEAENV